MGMNVSIDVVYGIHVDSEDAKTLFDKLPYDPDIGIRELIPENDTDINVDEDRYSPYIKQVDSRGNTYYSDWEWFTTGILLATNWDEEEIEQYLTPESIEKAKRLWNRYFLPLTNKQPHILLIGEYS